MNRKSQEEQLLQLRSQLVGVLHTQPASVYPDETIEALLDAQPKSIGELTKVKGFPAGGKRVKTFGELVVGIFNPSVKPADNKNSKTMNAFTLSQDNGKSTKNPPKKKLKTLAVLSLSGCVGLLGCRYQTCASVSGQQAAVQENIEKYRYMEAGKQEAKKNWVSAQEELLIRKLSEEAALDRARENAKAGAEKRRNRLNAKTVNKVQKNVKKAQKKTMRAAVDAGKYYKKLEKIAAKKKKTITSYNNGSDGYDTALSDYTCFSVGDEGRSEWKSWMPYLNESNTDSIFNKESPQYALQQKAYTGNWGIRMVDGRYCIAVASSYASTIGTKIDVVLESGKIIKCVLSDQKADADTDSLNRYHLTDGSYVEFIVSRALMDEQAKVSGSFNCISDFEGAIKEIRVQK